MWRLSPRHICLAKTIELYFRVPRPHRVICRNLNSVSDKNDRRNLIKWMLSFVGAAVGGTAIYANYDIVQSWYQSSSLFVQWHDQEDVAAITTSTATKAATTKAATTKVTKAQSTPEGFRFGDIALVQPKRDNGNKKKGLVLGIYEKTDGGKEVKMIMTSAAKKYTSSFNTDLKALLEIAGPTLKLGESRIFFGIDPTYHCVALVGLGPENAKINKEEDMDEAKENVRTAVAEGVRHLRGLGCQKIEVDPCNDSEAAAEGASLSLFSFDELRNQESRKKKVDLFMYNSGGSKDDWERGLLKGNGQNLARRMMELPANILTPTVFADIATEILSPNNIQVTPRNKQWIMEQKMGSFLSVSKGSHTPPVFLEMHYNGGKAKSKPIVLVGKGITFDSGGISLKTSKNMDAMRADMGGGACIVAAMHIIATLKVPVNVIGLIPLCENMPGGGATKPGDVVTAMNGTTIQIDNTDAEGRLVLADALHYAHRYDPMVILDMATLTGAIRVALGDGACGAYCTTPTLWKHIYQAGVKTGDRVWRMPLYKHYTKQFKPAHLADLNNISERPAAGSCYAAMFLKEFVTAEHWIHLDIAGVMETSGSEGAVIGGMSGRPTRTIVEFIRMLSENPLK